MEDKLKTFNQWDKYLSRKWLIGVIIILLIYDNWKYTDGNDGILILFILTIIYLVIDFVYLEYRWKVINLYKKIIRPT